jgi:hypothetical protein
MTPTTTAPPGRTAADARARAAALVSGATGIAANVFLVLFYALAAPFDGNGTGAGWLGSVSDWLEVPQFLALVPVVTALGRRLPRTSSLRVVTVAGAAAMATTAGAQLLLVLGLVRFEVQIVLVVTALALGYLWLLAISLAGHRTATLPRPLTLAGLLIGPSLMVGLVLAAAALVAPGPARPALLAAGIAIGAAGWLALPVIPLLVARFVVPKEEP